ncbi:MAG: AAA family ATPase [Chloroflexota bacterium]
MNLIYGPPAVGKLTVARALAKLTNYKLFHNHLSVDLVTSIFERGTPSFSKMIVHIRSALLEEAAKVGVDGIIFTMVFETPRKSIIDHYVDLIEHNQGAVCLVHLYCAPDTLAKRVQSAERHKFGKITSPDLLSQVLRQLQNPFSSVPDYQSLSLDTGRLSPEETAQQIIQHFL